MLRLALLTVGIWTAVSFLFTCGWVTAVSLLADPAGSDSPGPQLPGSMVLSDPLPGDFRGRNTAVARRSAERRAARILRNFTEL